MHQHSPPFAAIAPNNYLFPFVKTFQEYNNSQGWTFMGTFLSLMLVMLIAGKSKGKITTGRMARMAEKLAAVSTALKQMRERKHNRVTLWCGKPRYWIRGSFQGLGTYLQTLLGNPPTIFLPDAQRSLLVIGTPGSGKTASVIDSALESAFIQGFPVILYDKKGD